ncbi:MAG: C4-type zinc ribbon domain-containing protein [Bacteroidetes bacterium]|nr:hypothetical protein [Bacteroidota bacterium]MCZ2132209.1 C4-type zinc ribbon domain-containing protein [Bacteroidota bacterium]
MNSSGTQMQAIIVLAELDAELDEIRQELGDLPDQVKAVEDDARRKSTDLDETQQQLDDIHESRSRAAIALQELQDREAKYTEQQFNVRNNREFDAITTELEAIKAERARIGEEQRSSGVLEENLRALLGERQRLLDDAKAYLNIKERELTDHSKEHGERHKHILAERREALSALQTSAVEEYERIRAFHADAAVAVRRNSCAGCFSKVPPQKVVEIRNHQDKIYFCEHCGRILYTTSE